FHEDHSHPDFVSESLAERRRRAMGRQLSTRTARPRRRSKRASSEATLQKLRCRSFDDLESEIGGFAFEIVNLQFAVLGVVKLCSSVEECDAIAEHAIDQSCQLGRHS